MSTNNLRPDAYAAGITGLVDAHVAARVLSGPPSWREAALDVALTIACGALTLTSLSTPYLAALSGATGVSGAIEAVRSVRDDARETLRAVPPHALEEIAARHGWTFRRYIRLPGEQTIAAEEWMRTGARNVMIPADPSLDDYDSRVFDFCVKVAKASHLAPAEVLAEVFEEAEDR